MALCSASSEGQTVKVGNPSSPFQFKCNISASLGRVSTATFLLSGHLLCDFQVKRKEEETQLEEVDIYPPPKLDTRRLPPAIPVFALARLVQGWGGGGALSGLICEFCLWWLLGS